MENLTIISEQEIVELIENKMDSLNNSFKSNGVTTTDLFNIAYDRESISIIYSDINSCNDSETIENLFNSYRQAPIYGDLKLVSILVEGKFWDDKNKKDDNANLYKRYSKIREMLSLRFKSLSFKSKEVKF